MTSLLEKLYFAMVFGEITTAIARVMGGGESSDTAAGHTSNPLLLILNLVVVLGTFYYAYPRLPAIWSSLLRLKWLFLLYLWIALSLAWSVDRATSSRLAFYAFVYLLSAGYCAFRYSTRELLHLIGWCSLGAALLSIVGEFVLPPPNDPAPGWSGIFLQKNTLGLTMMIGVAVLLVQGRRWTPTRCAVLLLYLTLLVLSQSFTAIVGTAVVLLVVLSYKVGSRSKALLWIWLGGLLCVLLLVSDPLSLLLGAGGKTSNFTGRDVIWAYAFKGILEHPVIGHGYGGAFWADADDSEQALHWNPHHAHNGFLQVWLDLGVIGLILTIGLLANTWRRARRSRSLGTSDTALWTKVLITTALAHNLMESDFTSTNFFWYLLVLGSFACLRAEQENAVMPVMIGPESGAESDLESGPESGVDWLTA